MRCSRWVSGVITASSTAGPSGACTTTRAVALPAPGVCSRSWSMPTWARAPGTFQFVLRGAAEGAGEADDGRGDDQPGGDRPPRVGGGGSTEAVEEA